MTFLALDPRLYDLAGDFLMALPDVEKLSDRALETLRRRAAQAMQQAIDAELKAIRLELTA